MEKKNRAAKVDATDRAIKKCFLEMLKKQPVENINVGKLCEKAGVNRSTFYRHYADIFALLDAVVDECMDELFHAPVSEREIRGDFEEQGYQAILRVCETAIRKKALYQMLLYGRTNTKLIERMTEALYQFYMSTHESVSHYKLSDEVTLQYHYLASGVVGVWAAWIKEDCRIPKEKVAQTVKGQISAFFLNMNALYLPPEEQ